MEKKKKLSPLAIKIIIPLAGVLVAFILTLNIALSKISRTIESMTQLKDTDLITLNIAQDLRYSVLHTSEFFTDVSVVQELDEIEGGEEIKATVEADIAELSKIDPENAAYYNDVLSEYYVFYDLCKSMAYAYITEGTDAGNAIMEQVDPVTEELSEIMDSIAGQKQANAEGSALITAKDITLVKNILSFAGIFVLGFIAATVVVVFIAVVRPVKIVTKAISTLADRDLTLSELPVKSKDEMGQLTDSFNKLLVSTREVMQQIQDSSSNVDKGSVSVKNSADAIQENMTAIAEAVSNIAQGANDQAIEIEKTNEEIESLKEIIETNERAAGNLSEACEKISQASNEGTKIINDLYDVTKQSEVAFADIFTSIESIKDSSEKIRTASSMIESISSQTNLLSLNASIEAARAGEHGRGFAVVADEIRSLSDETQNCVLEINNMIENLQATVDLASVKSDGIKLTVEKQVKSVSDTKDKYADITNSVSAINEEITELGSVSSALSESVINVTEIMHVVASASEESSASTEETNASVEEVLAMVEEIAGEAADITSVSNVLKDQAALYKL